MSKATIVSTVMSSADVEKNTGANQTMVMSQKEMEGAESPQNLNNKEVTKLEIGTEDEHVDDQVLIGFPVSPLTDTQESTNGTISPAAGLPVEETPAAVATITTSTQDKQPKTTGDNKADRKIRSIKESRVIISKLLKSLEDVKEPANDNDSTTQQMLTFSKTPLKAYSSSESVSYETFKKSGGIGNIVIILRRYYNNSNILEHSSKVLMTFLLIDDNAIIPELIQLNIMEGILNSIKQFKPSQNEEEEESKVNLMKLLRILTQKEEHREEIIKNHSDILNITINLMKQNTDEYRLLSHSCLLLSNLAFGNKQIKMEIAKLNGITYIAKSMSTFPDQQTIQARGSLAIRNLCFDCVENQKIAGEFGAIEALISAMRLHNKDREIIHQSCIALVNMSNESYENRNRIVLSGGTQLFVNLMNIYKESMTIHDDCISIIRNIVVENKQVQEDINKLGGIEIIINALTKFNSNEKLCMKSCAALRYLCFLPVNRDKVSDLNGIKPIVNVLKQHKRYELAIEHTFLAIGNATFENEKNKIAVGDCGGLLAIVVAMEQHRLKSNIQEHGCRVIRNLVADSKINAERAVENGAITAAVFSMMGFADNPSVQEQACAMLVNMTDSEGVVEKFQQADVMRLAERCLSNHVKHRGVQLQAGILIDKLNGYELLTPKMDNSSNVDGVDGGDGRTGFPMGSGLLNRKSSQRAKKTGMGKFVWPFGKQR